MSDDERLHEPPEPPPHWGGGGLSPRNAGRLEPGLLALVGSRHAAAAAASVVSDLWWSHSRAVVECVRHAAELAAGRGRGWARVHSVPCSSNAEQVVRV
jgi:hypothetical protein